MEPREVTFCPKTPTDTPRSAELSSKSKDVEAATRLYLYSSVGIPKEICSDETM